MPSEEHKNMNTNSYTRRSFLKLAGLAAVSTVIAGCASSDDKKSRRKPNIVFILADDQGWHQLGCYGSDFYETPNIDRLAAEGMKFTDAYAACPVCSPTRASIMTGKYPARLHLTNFIPGYVDYQKLLPPEYTKYLPLEEVTIAEALKPAGYTCGHFGKWHLNKDKEYKLGRPGDPGSQGFDDVFTSHKPQKGRPSRYQNDAHHVREITERTIAFLENNKDRPFFCYVTHNTIHRPIIERPELVEKYKAKPQSKLDRNNPIVGAMVETLDKSIGTILDKLDELNLTNDTVVVYFSDNGPLRGRKELKPLRGGKGNLYEAGIRVPMLVRWPGVASPGSKCGQPVISCDFFPTLLEAAGMKVTDPQVDGKSLMPLLQQTGGINRDAIYWHYPHYSPQDGTCQGGAVRQGRYKLIEWYEKSIDGIDTPGALELFDLVDDISEQINLAERMPELKMQLYERLDRWRKSVNAQRMTKNPNYKLPGKT